MRNNAITLILVVGLLATMASFAPTAAATTHNVSTTAELEAAFAAAADGDTIVLATGLYFPSVELDMGDRAINVRGAGMYRTFIDGSNLVGVDFVIGRDDDSSTAVGDVTFEGFTVQNSPDTGIEMGDYESLTITSCCATGCEDGFYLAFRDRTSTTTVTGCLSENNSDEGFCFSGFDFDGAVTITWCTAATNEGEGFLLDVEFCYGAAITIQDCVSAFNGEDGFEVDADYGWCGIEIGRTATNNNGDDGIWIGAYEADSDIDVYDCHSYDNIDDGFDIDGDDEGDNDLDMERCQSETNGDNGFELDITDIWLSHCASEGNADRGFNVGCEEFSCYDSSAMHNGDHGFDIDGNYDEDLAIMRCISSYNGEDGFVLYDFDDAHVYNCISSYNGEDGFDMGDIEDDLYVYNCTAHANYSGGEDDVGFDIYDDDIVIKNCTATENGYGFDDNGDETRLYSCNAYGNRGPLDAEHTVGADYNLENVSSTLDACISVEPIFACEADNDLRPMAVSPLINAGMDLSGMVDDDIRGVARPQQGAFDIGAYEFEDVEPGLNPVGVVSFQPVMAAALSDAMVLWEDVLAQLPAQPSAEQQALLDQAQSLIEGATSISNYIAANGALRQAMAALGELQGTL